MHYCKLYFHTPINVLRCHNALIRCLRLIMFLNDFRAFSMLWNQFEIWKGASGLIIDFGTSKSAKIESLPSAVYSLGRHGSLSSRLRRTLRIFFAILLLYAFTAKTIASSTDLLWRLRHVARWEWSHAYLVYSTSRSALLVSQRLICAKNDSLNHNRSYPCLTNEGIYGKANYGINYKQHEVTV